MQTKDALKIIGGSLSKPSKMPGWSIGLPAKECKTGGKLQKVPGSVCFDCYALKGCYVFKVVQDAQYRRLAAIKSPDWVQAMAHLINSKKPDVFRWHDSGDVQDLDHLQKIYKVCQLTPGKRHWMPTREAWIKDHLQDKPNNLVIRFSAPMVTSGRLLRGLTLQRLLTQGPAVQLLLKTTNAETADNVGIQKLKQFHMVSIKEFPRGINSDRVISLS